LEDDRHRKKIFGVELVVVFFGRRSSIKKDFKRILNEGVWSCFFDDDRQRKKILERDKKDCVMV